MAASRRSSRRSELQFKIRIPFVDLLGFELVRFERGEAEIALTLRDEPAIAVYEHSHS